MRVSHIARNIEVFRQWLETGSFEQVAQKYDLRPASIRVIVEKITRFIASNVRMKTRPGRVSVHGKFKHPFTYEKYPELYVEKHRDREFNGWLIRYPDLLAEKEFALEQLEVFSAQHQRLTHTSVRQQVKERNDRG